MDLRDFDLSSYPDLAAPQHWEWGPIDSQFELLREMPDDRLISNVRIVPFVGESLLILKMADGQWDHPGGTREPGEEFVETARRELLEEAGARLISLRPFGLVKCHSHREMPYRPHVPHPDFIQIAATAEVEVVGEPSNPPGEWERIEFVEVLSLEEATSRLKTRDGDGGWMADLYRLGAHVRNLRQPPS